MNNLSLAPLYAGCDYLRVTSPDQGKSAEWFDVLLPEFVAAERAGRSPRLRGLLGYYGKMSEHAFVGHGANGSMAQVSSSFANHCFLPLSHSGGKATRLDLQVTMKVGCSPSSFLRYQFLALQEADKRRGKQPMVAIHDTSYGARMITIGSRQSLLYARIYDKYAESRQEAYEEMVRFEVEIKAEEARSVQVFLQDTRALMPAAKAIVANYFNQRGLEHDFEQGTLTEYIPDAKRHRTDETALAWIATQVQPTFSRLIHRGLVREAVSAIMGPEASPEALDKIQQIMLQYR